MNTDIKETFFRMTILITQSNNFTALAAIRSLGKERVIIYTADEKNLPLNLKSKYVKKHYKFSKNEETIKKDLLKIVKKTNCKVLMPIYPLTTEIVSKYKLEFQKLTNILIPDFKQFEYFNDKMKTYELTMKLSIDAPKKYEFEEITKKTTFPLVIKPQFNLGSATGIHIVNSFEDFKKKFFWTKKKYKDILIEEYITGSSSNMRTVNIIFDKKHNPIASFSSKKIEEYPSSGGTTTTSLSTRENDIISLTTKLLKHINWVGIAEAEFKIDNKNNKPKLIEINPRFWSYLKLPIDCGINFPKIYYDLALNKKVESINSYQTNVLFINQLLYFKKILKRKNKIQKKVFNKQSRYVSFEKDVFPVLGTLLAKIREKIKNCFFKKRKL